MSLAGKLKELVLRIGERIVRRVQQDVEAGQILVVEHGIQAGLARQARRCVGRRVRSRRARHAARLTRGLLVRARLAVTARR